MPINSHISNFMERLGMPLEGISGAGNAPVGAGHDQPRQASHGQRRFQDAYNRFTQNNGANVLANLLRMAEPSSNNFWRAIAPELGMDPRHINQTDHAQSPAPAQGNGHSPTSPFDLSSTDTFSSNLRGVVGRYCGSVPPAVEVAVNSFSKFFVHELLKYLDKLLDHDEQGRVGPAPTPPDHLPSALKEVMEVLRKDPLNPDIWAQTHAAAIAQGELQNKVSQGFLENIGQARIPKPNHPHGAATQYEELGPNGERLEQEVSDHDLAPHYPPEASGSGSRTVEPLVDRRARVDDAEDSSTGPRPRPR